MKKHNTTTFAVSLTIGCLGVAVLSAAPAPDEPWKRNSPIYAPARAPFLKKERPTEKENTFNLKTAVEFRHGNSILTQREEQRNVELP